MLIVYIFSTKVGTIICNEEACARVNAYIPLSKTTKLADGGRSEGIGSLMQYRVS